MGIWDFRPWPCIAFGFFSRKIVLSAYYTISGDSGCFFMFPWGLPQFQNLSGHPPFAHMADLVSHLSNSLHTCEGQQGSHLGIYISPHLGVRNIQPFPISGFNFFELVNWASFREGQGQDSGLSLLTCSTQIKPEMRLRSHAWLQP